MSFRFYTNAISQASKNVAAGIFITGLLLIGFGFLIYILKEIFAILAAIVFSVAGAGCLIIAVKIFLAQRKLDKISSEDSEGYRENVHIHIEEHHGE
jgi:cobalamin biosynthesis protein CobD/CbiB